jgi:hypothetical protein
LVCFHIAVDTLRQLRVHLVGDDHDVRQHRAEIHVGQVALDGLEDAHLQDAGLLHDQGRGVALTTAEFSAPQQQQSRWPKLRLIGFPADATRSRS